MIYVKGLMCMIILIKNAGSILQGCVNDFVQQWHIGRPKMMILDETFNGLDPQGIWILKNLI